MNLAQGTAVVAHTAEVQFAVLPAHQDVAEMDIQAAENENKQAPAVQEGHLEPDLVQTT